MTIRVSIIIPAFDSGKYIRDAIDSALMQGYRDTEIIVVDDGSTDDTIDVVKSYGDRVRLFTQQNEGPGAARNKGVAEARGEYIAFLDSDDYWLPGKLTPQVRYLDQHPEIGLVFHGWWHLEADSPEEQAIRSKLPDLARECDEDAMPSVHVDWLYNDLLFDTVVWTTSVMMRRELFHQMGGFDPELRKGQDLDLWLKVSRQTAIAKLDANFAVYRARSASVTTTPRAINYHARILQRALDKWGREGPDGKVSAQKDIDKLLANSWFAFAYAHITYGGDCQVALHAYISSLRWRPFQPKTWYLILRTALMRLFRGRECPR